MYSIYMKFHVHSIQAKRLKERNIPQSPHLYTKERVGYAFRQVGGMYIHVQHAVTQILIRRKSICTCMKSAVCGCISGRSFKVCKAVRVIMTPVVDRFEGVQ